VHSVGQQTVACGAVSGSPELEAGHTDCRQLDCNRDYHTQLLDAMQPGSYVTHWSGSHALRAGIGDDSPQFLYTNMRRCAQTGTT